MMIILYKIISGIGIPTLRYHHNKIKMELLKLSPKNNLLDIGSAKGGDIHEISNCYYCSRQHGIIWLTEMFTVEMIND